MARRIEDLNLSVRAYNCLKRAGIDTIEQLKGCNQDELLRIRNLGKKCIDEITYKLSCVENAKVETDDAEKYILTMSGKQLEVINKALEWFFRLQMGQFSDYATEVSRNGYEYDKNNPDNERLFSEYINRRNASQEMFERAFRVSHPKPSEKTQDIEIAEDMWTAIRHFMWEERPEPKPHYTTDSFDPLFISSVEPIVIVAKHDTVQ